MVLDQDAVKSPHAKAQRSMRMQRAQDCHARAATISPEQRRELLFGTGASLSSVNAETAHMLLEASPKPSSGRHLDVVPLSKSRTVTNPGPMPLHLRMQALELNAGRNRAQLMYLRPQLDGVTVPRRA